MPVISKGYAIFIIRPTVNNAPRAIMNKRGGIIPDLGVVIKVTEPVDRHCLLSNELAVLFSLISGRPGVRLTLFASTALYHVVESVDR
jgi:hypothetical protein